MDLSSLSSQLPRPPLKMEENEELLSAFKSAACAVTKLYKTASSISSQITSNSTKNKEKDSELELESEKEKQKQKDREREILKNLEEEKSIAFADGYKTAVNDVLLLISEHEVQGSNLSQNYTDSLISKLREWATQTPHIDLKNISENTNTEENFSNINQKNNSIENNINHKDLSFKENSNLKSDFTFNSNIKMTSKPTYYRSDVVDELLQDINFNPANIDDNNVTNNSNNSNNNNNNNNNNNTNTNTNNRSLFSQNPMPSSYASQSLSSDDDSIDLNDSESTNFHTFRINNGQLNKRRVASTDFLMTDKRRKRL